MTRPSDRTIELIHRLVGFDTVSRKSNLRLIEFVRDSLAGLGVDSILIPDETGTKANLFATIGPKDRPGIALSGHTDVVPVDDQNWSSDPFVAVEKNGKIYGRGTADMKSFVAVALALVPEMVEAQFSAPIHLAFSYDEEIGCVGVRGLIAALARMPVKPMACIVGEPTGMKVVTAHKGKAAMRCLVHGLACHSAMAPYGVNAVETAAEIVTYLRAMGRRLRARCDPGFDPPFGTVHTGTISGGIALNIVPAECIFDFEIRTLPGESPEDLIDEVREYADTALVPDMRAISPLAGITWEALSGFPGLATPEDSDIAQLAKTLSGSNSAGKVSFGTEAGLFHEAGIPAVVCGPGGIAEAHKPDEFVALDQVARCEDFLRRLIGRMTAT
jgi:acetylornithine deacetylase